MTKSKFIMVLIGYFFVMNTITMSLSYVQDTLNLEGNFENPTSGNDLIPGLSFAKSLGDYFYQLMTFQIEGLNPAIVFLVFYLPIIAIAILVYELIRGV